GSGGAPWASGLDKVGARPETRAAGVPPPDWAAFNAPAFGELGAADTLEEIEDRLGFPLVVKPASQGSSLGVEFASSRDDVPAALVAAFSYDDRVLLERYVKGRELAVSMLDGEPLPVVEAIPREEDFFNFEARYEIGRTEYVCPAELGDDQTLHIREIAARTYDRLGGSGVARVDLMLGEGGPEVLEVNAIPGLTDTSLLPMAAEAAGIDFVGLVERILDSARLRPRAPAESAR